MKNQAGWLTGQTRTVPSKVPNVQNTYCLEKISSGSKGLGDAKQREFGHMFSAI